MHPFPALKFRAIQWQVYNLMRYLAGYLSRVLFGLTTLRSISAQSIDANEMDTLGTLLNRLCPVHWEGTDEGATGHRKFDVQIQSTLLLLPWPAWLQHSQKAVARRPILAPTPRALGWRWKT